MSTITSTSRLADARQFSSRYRKRQLYGKLFEYACFIGSSVGVVFLVVLLIYVVYRGFPGLRWEFITSFPSRIPERAGIYSALVGTVWMIGFTALFAIPIGVAAAIWLEEYPKRGWLSKFIEINVNNLAGVPSIVYGLLGLGLFVRFFMLGRSILAGSLTMALLILPIIIVSAREAIRAVPPSYREAAYAVGATRRQVIWNVVLPAAIPSILTGIILALSRAIGETAPLITIGALTFIAFLPQSPLDPFTVLPIQIFNWVSRPQPEFHTIAATGIIVLLAVLLVMNSVAIYFRDRTRRNLEW